MDRIEQLEKRIAELEQLLGLDRSCGGYVKAPYSPVLAEYPCEACRRGGVCGCILNAPRIT